MKKEYNKPTVTVTVFNNEDVIQLSSQAVTQGAIKKVDGAAIDF